jgi:hypothetical protein
VGDASSVVAAGCSRQSCLPLLSVHADNFVASSSDLERTTELLTLHLQVEVRLGPLDDSGVVDVGLQLLVSGVDPGFVVDATDLGDLDFEFVSNFVLAELNCLAHVLILISLIILIVS